MQAASRKQRRRPRLTATKAPTTPASPMTEPSDRSSPPEPMTKVAAIASTPMVEVASRMLRKLLSDRKKGDSTAMAALSTSSTTKDSSLMCSRSTERAAPAPRDRAAPVRRGSSFRWRHRLARAKRSWPARSDGRARARRPVLGGLFHIFEHRLLAGLEHLLGQHQRRHRDVGLTVSPAIAFLTFSTACLPTR